MDVLIMILEVYFTSNVCRGHEEPPVNRVIRAK